jgi:hypothetical protein
MMMEGEDELSIFDLCDDVEKEDEDSHRGGGERSSVKGPVPHETPIEKSIQSTKSYRDDFRESISGLYIRNREVSQRRMADYMSGRQYVSMGKMREMTDTSGLGVKCDFVLIGVLASSERKYTAQKKRFLVWKLHDLEGASITVFLFDEADDKHRYETGGSVWAILNPKVIRSSSEAGSAAFSVTQAQKLLRIGMSRDFGVCKAIRKDGQSCKNVINLEYGEYCEYHVHAEYKKMLKTPRLELHGASCAPIRNPMNGSFIDTRRFPTGSDPTRMCVGGSIGMSFQQSHDGSGSGSGSSDATSMDWRNMFSGARSSEKITRGSIFTMAARRKDALASSSSKGTFKLGHGDHIEMSKKRSSQPSSARVISQEKEEQIEKMIAKSKHGGAQLRRVFSPSPSSSTSAIEKEKSSMRETLDVKGEVKKIRERRRKTMDEERNARNTGNAGNAGNAAIVLYDDGVAHHHHDRRTRERESNSCDVVDEPVQKKMKRMVEFGPRSQTIKKRMDKTGEISKEELDALLRDSDIRFSSDGCTVDSFGNEISVHGGEERQSQQQQQQPVGSEDAMTPKSHDSDSIVSAKEKEISEKRSRFEDVVRSSKFPSKGMDKFEKHIQMEKMLEKMESIRSQIVDGWVCATCGIQDLKLPASCFAQKHRVRKIKIRKFFHQCQRCLHISDSVEAVASFACKWCGGKKFKRSGMVNNSTRGSEKTRSQIYWEGKETPSSTFL